LGSDSGSRGILCDLSITGGTLLRLLFESRLGVQCRFLLS
jgi:hypothetical protein